MRSIFLTDPEGLQMSTNEKRLYILIAAFMISFFIPRMPVINNVFFGLLFLYCILFNSFSEKVLLLRRRLAIVGMIAFFCLQSCSIMYSDNKSEAIGMLVMRLPLLMFPIAFGSISIGDHLRKKLLILWVMVIVLASIVSAIVGIVNFTKTGDSSWLYNDSLTGPALAWQSSYFAMLLTVTFYILVYLIHTGAWPVPRIGTVIICIFLLIFHFLLASRASILLLYFSIILYALYFIILKKKFKLGLLVIGGLVLGGVLLLSVFPKTINRFKELGYRNYEYANRGAESHYNMEVKADQWNGANIRLAVWQCGWELAQQNPLLGTGIGDKMDDLLKVYKKNGFVMGVETRRNLHNTYLDVLVATGFIGLLLFALSWILLPLKSCFTNRDWLGACIIGAIAMGAITETYIDRSQGNYMFSFLITFMISSRKQDQ